MGLKVFYPRSSSAFYTPSADQQALQVLHDTLEPSVEFITGPTFPEPADYDILISGSPNQEQLESSPNLRAVVIPWAGLPIKTAELMEDYPHISVHNLHHNAVPTAETALMLMMAAAKLIIPIESKFREHDWRPRYAPNPALLLSGRTVFILGFGHIGQHIGQVCAVMGMNVSAIRKNPTASLDIGYEANVHPIGTLHDLLPRANVLMVTLPATEETRGMIGEQELALLPENAIVVNVGRGAVIEQKALYDALASGQLHSAGIDVWYNYPPDEESRANTPPADYPFHELDNIVMSPHRGGGAQDVQILRMSALAKLLNAAAREKEIPNQVNLKSGY